MERVSVDQLKAVIESQHGGKGSFVRSVRVLKGTDGRTGWDGIVHVFALKGHPNARQAYAWASPILGSTKPRYFAVLHQGQVRGPAEAVGAAVAAIRRWGKG